MKGPTPIGGACAWRGDEMAASTRWIRPLHAATVAGELMREIRDEGRAVGERYGQIPTASGGPGAVLSSYARTLSNGPLRFHTDRCDVVGLLCARTARTGGVSKLASSVAVHDEMIRRRPDLAAVLYRDVYRSRFGELPRTTLQRSH